MDWQVWTCDARPKLLETIAGADYPLTVETGKTLAIEAERLRTEHHVNVQLAPRIPIPRHKGGSAGAGGSGCWYVVNGHRYTIGYVGPAEVAEAVASVESEYRRRGRTTKAATNTERKARRMAVAQGQLIRRGPRYWPTDARAKELEGEAALNVTGVVTALQFKAKGRPVSASAVARDLQAPRRWARLILDRADAWEGPILAVGERPRRRYSATIKENP